MPHLRDRLAQEAALLLLRMHLGFHGSDRLTRRRKRLVERDAGKIVGKTIEWKMFDGSVVNVALTPTGRATVSGVYDVVANLNACPSCRSIRAHVLLHHVLEKVRSRLVTRKISMQYIGCPTQFAR
ncbi:hypothetical protein [Variovorax sp. J22R115]|uniref:hypothetical protein n=1 Tax=Variovorax sp. J22R115 TaxID=3053509 RepID=UPI002577D8AD|nr:hypothetical protein [Variovorax sp. J22R115]MDM0050570.1 hypothetical protein [Variovorax sp. J22R115]